MKLRSALPTLAAAALVLLPAVAHADTLTRNDQAGDVFKSSLGDSSGGAVDATRTNGDIIRSVITHGAANVKIKLVHRDLVKTGAIVTIISVKSNKKFVRFEITAGPGKYYGKVTARTRSDKKIRCRTTHKIDYAANTTLLTIPRSCLGKPKWVRVGAGVISIDDKTGAFYGDDARTNGTVSGQDPVFSKKVFR